MNILYLADPSRQSHDLKWINFFEGRFNNIYIVFRERSSYRIDYSYFENKKITIIGAINDFSIFRPLSTIKSYLFIRSVIKKYKVDIFHIFYAEPNALWAIFKNSFNCKIALTTRGTDILVTISEFGMYNKVQDYYVYPLYRFALKNFDFITCTSKSQKDKIEQITNHKISPYIIRTGINFSLIKRTETNNNISIDGEYILFPRNMKPLYNHELAISSLRFLNKKIKSSYTFVFLDKNSEDSAYIKTIEGLMGQFTDIKFLFLKRLDEKSFCHLLKSARLVVITAKSDGSPVTAMQAMAFGIPVILPPLKYDDDIFGEWIYKLASWDEEELAKMITTVLSDIYESNKIKAQKAMQRFADFETEMTKLLNLYITHTKKI